MPLEDFDVNRLAAFLHLTPPQVSRLADRGKLPGRKVAGQWRFSQAEIHHWLEDRIGLSDESELLEVEGVLDRASTDSDEQPIQISQMLPVEAIAMPLVAKTRSSVISTVVNLAADTGLLWDPDKMAQAVSDREQLHPTALDNGVALMHPRRPLAGILSEAFLALGITSRGIPFGGGRSLTDVFFLICSVEERGHLRVLARLSRLISDSSLLADIREAADAHEVHQLIEACEAELD